MLTLLSNVLGVFVQDFGLDVETFQQMVGDCPPDFLELAISCCNVRNLHIILLNCSILLK